MSSIGTGYDQSTTTFSPDGRVFQIEYAAKAVENSGTAIGIRCKDGVVLGVEKQKLSKMMLPGSNRRIYTVDKCTGIAVSGMMADARQARWPRATAAALFRHLLAAVAVAAARSLAHLRRRSHLAGRPRASSRAPPLRSPRRTATARPAAPPPLIHGAPARRL